MKSFFSDLPPEYVAMWEAEGNDILTFLIAWTRIQDVRLYRVLQVTPHTIFAFSRQHSVIQIFRWHSCVISSEKECDFLRDYISLYSTFAYIHEVKIFRYIFKENKIYLLSPVSLIIPLSHRNLNKVSKQEKNKRAQNVILKVIYSPLLIYFSACRKNLHFES